MHQDLNPRHPYFVALSFPLKSYLLHHCLACLLTISFPSSFHMTDSQGNITGEKMPLVSIIDDISKPKDSMPNTSKKWRNTDLKSQDLQLKKDRPRISYLKIVTLNINAIRNKKEKKFHSSQVNPQATDQRILGEVETALPAIT